MSSICFSCTKANLAAVAMTARRIDPPSSYLVLGSSTLDDDAAGGSNGNDDGIANPCEIIELWANVRNVGAQTATGVTGTLTISIGCGYHADSIFKLKVGTAVYDECEAEAPWSLASPGDNATSGFWVRGDPVGTISNSQPCQPEDDHAAAPATDCYVTGQGAVGGAADAADVDGGRTTLTTPLLDLSHIAGARVTYWRWYTNNLGSSPGLDRWWVHISGDGGTTWVPLENTTASANSWTQMSFLVSDFLTPTSQMRVRFIANDMAPNSLIEAAVDDFEVRGTSTPVGIGEQPTAVLLRLDTPRPNPFPAGTHVRFALPQAGPLSLQIFGIDGRLVRTLVRGTLPAGEHDVIWDGRNGSGRPTAPGVYFCRLTAGSHELSQRMVLAP